MTAHILGITSHSRSKKRKLHKSWYSQAITASRGSTVHWAELNLTSGDDKSKTIGHLAVGKHNLQSTNCLSFLTLWASMHHSLRLLVAWMLKTLGDFLGFPPCGNHMQRTWTSMGFDVTSASYLNMAEIEMSYLY